eukprot:CAMPEP_0170553566 /NCGR_PEP_ID=MMETSP0211-20121228/11401_1 /TAXON_ID=311385 /ORGANISM="Pseudokeronopsis sp., Strain OXSARD2" /LENGTH=81 /DNA_ID=CAMNT_0010861995 /DNA_START=18 /DNA_END=263 /DNA_ORIENTATION=-
MSFLETGPQTDVNLDLDQFLQIMMDMQRLMMEYKHSEVPEERARIGQDLQATYRMLTSIGDRLFLDMDANSKPEDNSLTGG